MPTMTTMTSRTTVSTGFPLPTRMPFAPGAGGRWRAALAAARAWWSRRNAPSARHVDEALCGLSPHVLRDIGAPAALFACALERDTARPRVADLEFRG